MTIKRLFLILLAAILLPGFAYAQTRATFEVTKQFEDTGNDNTATVNLTLSCDDGIPIDEETGFKDGVPKTFVVTNFDDNMKCHVEEEPLDGYTSDVSECVFNDVDDGESYSCTVYNDPIPVQLDICKEWVIDNASGGGSDVEQSFELTLTCTNPIDAALTDASGSSGDENFWVRWEDLSGEYCGTGNSKALTAAIEPEWDGHVDKGVAKGTKCDLSESGYDSSVEVGLTDCKGLYFAIGSADQECTVVNTVFYEGIPTLSQYGMAIMALLMLGVGFVGFRRFV